MAKQSEDFYDLLRERGLRKSVAKPIAALEGNRQRAGAKGEQAARQAVDDLTTAADEIRIRVLRTDRARSRGAQKAAKTRSRNSAKRRASAKKGAKTRGKVARARGKG